MFTRLKAQSNFQSADGTLPAKTDVSLSFVDICAQKDFCMNKISFSDLFQPRQLCRVKDCERCKLTVVAMTGGLPESCF